MRPAVADSFERTVSDYLDRVATTVQDRRLLPADLLEGDQAFMAIFDAPGATPGDVRVSFEDGVLGVRIGRSRGRPTEFELRRSGRSIALEGRVELPADARVDPDRATARLTERGILEIELPKTTVDSSSADESKTADDSESTDG